MRVDVQDYVAIIDAVQNNIIYNDNYLASHDILVHQLMLSLENYLLNTVK